MTLQGPADADNYRTKIGRYRERWYVDPLPACGIADATDDAWPSISAVKPPFANPYVAMRRVAEMPDTEWRRLAAIDTEDRYEHIKIHDYATGRVAMERGSIVHLWAEDLIAGREPNIDQIVHTNPQARTEALLYLDALKDFFDTHQPEPVAVEVVCINRGLNGVGYGGTGDLIARIDGYGTLKVDWKSRGGAHDAYPEEAAQVAGYALADYIITEQDGQPVRAPVPHLDGGAVVSIRPDGYKVYPIDLDRAGRLFTAMHGWWEQQRNHNSIGKPWAPKARTLPATATEPGTAAPDGGAVEAASAAPGQSSPAAPGQLSSDKTQTIGALRRRLNELIETTDCTRGDISEAWPDDCGPLSENLTDDQLDRIAGTVDLLEIGYGLNPAHVPTVDGMILRLEKLPADLLAAASAHAKALDPPIPNLRTGKATTHDLERLVAIIEPLETQAKQRLTHLVNQLTPLNEADADGLIAWATEQRDQPLTEADADSLARLDNLEAERLCALAELHLNNPPDLVAHLIDICGSKSAALEAGKRLAGIHGMPAPKSTADVAADRALTALVTATAKETAS